MRDKCFCFPVSLDGFSKDEENKTTLVFHESWTHHDLSNKNWNTSFLISIGQHKTKMKQFVAKALIVICMPKTDNFKFLKPGVLEW